MSLNIKCQVFTPKRIVQDLLDVVGYSDDLYGKKVAENSCGDGNILVEIVERYIVDGLKNGYSLSKLKDGLERDIWGAEIDEAHILNCKLKLDNVATVYGLTNISWRIVKGDFLKLNLSAEFDYVVGNPPYITYKELDKESRRFIRDVFSTCKNGKFDYCYAFIEASIKSLKGDGKLAYLIPSNIFKNQFAFNLRNWILPHLTDVYDYTTQKLFAGKLTASSIIVCHMNNSDSFISYHNVNRGNSIKIEKLGLDDKWVFKEGPKEASHRSDREVRFGDYFHAASTIATLLNEVYIISDFVDCGDYLQVNEYRIEKSLLRTAVSPRSKNFNKVEYVVFPYYYTDEGMRRYTEEEFSKLFPRAEAYLKQHGEKLKKRNMDKGASWFEYGRSQALAHLNQPKLLISTLVTRKVRSFLLDEHTIPTSGLYIVPKAKRPNCDLHKAKRILDSELFLEYVKGIGVISNGNSYRISPKDINDFKFPVDILDIEE